MPIFFNTISRSNECFSFAVYLYLSATIYRSTTLLSIYVSLYTEILYICHSFLYIRNICISYTSLNASEFQNSHHKIILFHFCHSSYNNVHAILSLILLSYSYEDADLLSPIFSILDSLCISSHIILITWHVSPKPVHSTSSRVHSSPVSYSSYRRYTVRKFYLVFLVCHL